MTERPTVPAAKRPLWQLFAWLLIVIGAYDGGVLTFGPQHYFSSPAYYAVRAIGLRPVGVTLLLVVAAFLTQMRNPDRRALLAVLTAGFAYNVFWLAALLYSWLSVGITGLTGPSKSAGLAAAYCFLALRIDERRRG